jgi:hypothetical protein
MNMAGSSRFSITGCFKEVRAKVHVAASVCLKKIARLAMAVCLRDCAVQTEKVQSDVLCFELFQKSYSIGRCRLAPLSLSKKASSNLHMLCVRAFSNQVRMCSCADRAGSFKIKDSNQHMFCFVACGYTLPGIQRAKMSTDTSHDCGIFPVSKQMVHNLMEHVVMLAGGLFFQNQLMTVSWRRTRGVQRATLVIHVGEEGVQKRMPKRYGKSK